MSTVIFNVLSDIFNVFFLKSAHLPHGIRVSNVLCFLLYSATPASKFSFSPLGNYLLVCFRFEPTQCPENLRLMEARGVREIARLPQRGVGELSWPPLRWTGGESFMCHMVSLEEGGVCSD